MLNPEMNELTKVVAASAPAFASPVMFSPSKSISSPLSAAKIPVITPLRSSPALFPKSANLPSISSFPPPDHQLSNGSAMILSQAMKNFSANPSAFWKSSLLNTPEICSFSAVAFSIPTSMAFSIAVCTAGILPVSHWTALRRMGLSFSITSSCMVSIAPLSSSMSPARLSRRTFDISLAAPSQSWRDSVSSAIFSGPASINTIMPESAS